MGFAYQSSSSSSSSSSQGLFFAVDAGLIGGGFGFDIVDPPITGKGLAPPMTGRGFGGAALTGASLSSDSSDDSFSSELFFLFLAFLAAPPPNGGNEFNFGGTV